jgi:hypothetical protein
MAYDLSVCYVLTTAKHFIGCYGILVLENFITISGKGMSQLGMELSLKIYNF